MAIVRIATGLAAAGMILAGCVSDAATPPSSVEPVEAPSTTEAPAADVPDGVWNTSPDVVPDGVGAPILDGGTLLNSLEAGDRVVVTVSYPGDRRVEIAAMYADWAAAAGRAEHERGTLQVGADALWFERWETSGVEVRLVDCIHPRNGTFTLTCVAITTDRAVG